MRYGKKLILMPTLAAGLMMAWAIAQSSPALAQRGGGRGGGGGGMSHGGGGGMSHGGGGGMSRGGGGGMSHGGGGAGGGSSFSGGGFAPGGPGYSGHRSGGYSRGGFSGGAPLHGGGGAPHGRSYPYYPSHRPGFGYFGPGIGIYFGSSLYPYPYYDYWYYSTPYYTAPYYSGYALPYVEQYGAVDAPPAASTASTNGAVISAAGNAADFQLQAEQAFREHRYEDAARLNGHAIVEDGRNGKLHLFASQTLFALGDFQGAAAAIQQGAAVLERGEWGFVVENYAKFYRGDDYVTQTAKLVEFIKQNPDASYVRLLLGYHYKFLGYNEAAREALAKAVELERRDRLAAELLKMAGGEAPKTPVLPPPPLPLAKSPPAEELVIPGPTLKPPSAAPSGEKR